MIQRNSSFASSHEVWKYICELGISKVGTVSNFHLILKNLLIIRIIYNVFQSYLTQAVSSGDSYKHSAELALRKYYPKPVRQSWSLPSALSELYELEFGLCIDQQSGGLTVHFTTKIQVCSDMFLTFKGIYVLSISHHVSCHLLVFFLLKVVLSTQSFEDLYIDTAGCFS